MQPRGWLPEAFLQPSASPDTGPPLRDLLPTLNSEARLQCLWGSHLILGQQVDGRPSIEVAPCPATTGPRGRGSRKQSQRRPLEL